MIGSYNPMEAERWTVRSYNPLVPEEGDEALGKENVGKVRRPEEKSLLLEAMR